MFIFHDAAEAHPRPFAPVSEYRLPANVSLLIVLGLVALSWGAVGGIIMAVRATLAVVL